jgi:hypothetical protein
MRTASSQRRTTNWVISIVLSIFLTAAGYTALRAANGRSSLMGGRSGSAFAIDRNRVPE